MFRAKRKFSLETERLSLRPPEQSDYHAWASLRENSRTFLQAWDPAWRPDHLTKTSFTNRVYWAHRSIAKETAIPLLLIRRDDQVLIGSVTLDNIRRGPAQTATIGYWVGQEFARQGYMKEAVLALNYYAFKKLDLSRIEAGCLPENTPSRRLLEQCGYKYEGVAQSYLQINGRWRNHVLYANLRHDRRGKTTVM